MQNKLILVLSVLVILLFGIILGMVFSRNPLVVSEQLNTHKNKNAIVDTSQAGPYNTNTNPYAVSEQDKGFPLPSEYWITKKIEDKVDGFIHSLWIEPKRRGKIYLEECQYPDYKVKITKERKTAYIPINCKIIINGSLQSFTKDTLKIWVKTQADPISVNYQLSENFLNINFNDQKLSLKEGSRNTLFEAVENLPSVKRNKEIFLKNFTDFNKD
jgi:hypothetical protein